MSAGTTWHVVYTRPNAEEVAARNLQRQGFEVFLPRYQKKRRHARRVETVVRPLFPRYLMVAIDLAVDRWRSVRSTLGVAGLVGSDERPTPVPTAVIDELLSRRDESGLIVSDEQPFRPGDRVQLIDGAFAEFLGRVERLTDSERVAVLLDLMGRGVRVTLSAEGLAPA